MTEAAPLGRQASEAALALLQHFEQGPNGGFAPCIYRDWADHETIGWGHRVRPGERFQQPISAVEADRLLAADVARFATNIAASLRNRPEITQSMFDALVCLGFNIGLGALLGSTLMARLRTRDWQAAADQFLRWNKATNPKTGKKEPLAGLTRRRQAERELFLREGIPDNAKRWSGDGDPHSE
jgi:lysozyme